MPKRFNKILFLPVLVVVIFPFPVFAWGSITHMAINHQVFQEVGDNSISGAYESFVMAGQNPDMIVFFPSIISLKGKGCLLTDSDRFDYAHDLAEYNNSAVSFPSVYTDDVLNSDPSFGKFLIKAYQETKHPERFKSSDYWYALGWTGHQIGDRQAHGINGYVKRVISEMSVKEPEREIHLAIEFRTDAYLYNQFKNNTQFISQLKSSPPPKLVHEGSIIAYNQLKKSNDSRFVDRQKGILIEERVKNISKSWAGWLESYKQVIKAVAWGEKRTSYQPPSYFQTYFDQSVSDLAAFVQNPNTEIPENNPIVFTETAPKKHWLAKLWQKVSAFFGFNKGTKTAFAQEPEPLLEEDNSAAAFYQFFYDLAQTAEENGAMNTYENIIDQGLPTERIEYVSEIVDENIFNQTLNETIQQYQQNTSTDYLIMGNFVDILINHPEIDLEDTITYAADLEPPEITINWPQTQNYLNLGTATIDFSVTDEKSGVATSSATLNGQLVTNGQNFNLSLMPLGSYLFEVFAQDNKGNTTTTQVLFNLITDLDTLAQNIWYYYNLGLINNSGIANSLVVKLKQGDKNLFKSFLDELSAQRGKHLSEIVYVLLRDSLEY